MSSRSWRCCWDCLYAKSGISGFHTRHLGLRRDPGRTETGQKPWKFNSVSVNAEDEQTCSRNTDSLGSPRRLRRFALHPWPLRPVDLKFDPGSVLKFAHGSSQRNINLVAWVSARTPSVLIDNTLRVPKSVRHASAGLIGRAIACGSQSLGASGGAVRPYRSPRSFI
jgi:hypothetical protein